MLCIWNPIRVFYYVILKANNENSTWIFHEKEISVTFPCFATLWGMMHKNEVLNSFRDSGAKEIDVEIISL